MWQRYMDGNIKENNMAKNPIYFMEKNVHGAWVIYGLLGVKQYYYYTKEMARQMYIEEYNKTYFVNEKGE